MQRFFVCQLWKKNKMHMAHMFSIAAVILLVTNASPVSWGCRIHQLHLCRGVRSSPQWVSWICHLTIWWWGSSNAEVLGNAEYSYVLTCWPGQKCHSRGCTGRKWHILMAVMRGNHVGGNWLMKWDEIKKNPIILSQTDTPEESDLWTGWQLFPLDDDHTGHSKVSGSDTSRSLDIGRSCGSVSISPRGSLKVI